jgi:hypothetical protein
MTLLDLRQHLDALEVFKDSELTSYMIKVHWMISLEAEVNEMNWYLDFSANWLQNDTLERKSTRSLAVALIFP